MSYEITDAAAEYPVSRVEAKAHLRVTTADDDSYIDALIAAATEHVEADTKRALVTQTWAWRLDAFPAVFEVPKPPLQSVASIQYSDTDGVSQVLASSVYTVDASADPGRIVLAYGQSWPSTLNVINAVKVTFSAGYGDAADVPAPIRQAILLLIAQMYEFREPTITGAIVASVPKTYDFLLAPYRVYYF